jgi:hypothetical protein
MILNIHWHQFSFNLFLNRILKTKMCLKSTYASHLIANLLLSLPNIYFGAVAYLLTPWSRIFLEKLTGLQLVKKFPAFYGTRRFLTALTIARHLSLSWASPIHSSHPHPTSWRSIITLSPHLRLGLPSGLFHSGFPTRTLYTPLPFPNTCYMPRPSQSSRLYHPHDIG